MRALALTLTAFAAPFVRTYAARPGQTPNDSNAANPQANNADGQAVNKSRAIEEHSQQDTKSAQNPVSNPEATGLGEQETTTESADHMKHDPSESGAEKRKKTLEFGQNKKLDPADEAGAKGNKESQIMDQEK